MITLHAMRNVDGDKLYAYDFMGLSTDAKPTFWGGRLIEANSLFFEEDTCDFYYCESHGSKPTKTVLIEEQSFTGTRVADWYEYEFEVVELVQDVLFIKFDGTEYRCTKTVHDLTNNMYGAPFGGGQFDFSTYPFCVVYSTVPQVGGTFIEVPDGSEHTVEVYTEGGGTPAVWKKVGSGS